MTDQRMRRRIVGALGKRLDEVGLEDVPDARDPRGKRWKLATVLRMVILGMVAGTKSVSELEELSSDLSLAVRRRLRISRRLPDTTAREILCGLMPQSLVFLLHRIIRSAMRRKAIHHDDLPFGVISLDGKGTALSSSDDWYAQRQTHDGGQLTGVVRTVNAVLTSSSARPVVDVTTIPASTNEMGYFQTAFESLLEAYPGVDLFRLVTYDAGATSLENATFVREQGVHYLLGLKATQPSLRHEAERLLGGRDSGECDAETVDADGTTRRIFLTTVEPGLCGWQHLRSFVRVDSISTDKLGKVNHETRYFLSSLPAARLKAQQWLLIVRRHWGVETAHQILDVTFEEDARPWIETNPRGAVVVMLLRRIAYTLLSFFRSVTLRADHNREMPWKTLMRKVWTTFVAASHDDLRDLRRHSLPAPS